MLSHGLPFQELNKQLGKQVSILTRSAKCGPGEFTFINGVSAGQRQCDTDGVFMVHHNAEN